jgi:ligand-binding SRPBCC domain-containing protein
MPLLKLTTRIHASPETCCRISLSAEAHLGSMAHTGERVVGGRSSGIFEAGDTVIWEARHLGRVRRLEVRITSIRFPGYFRDEMIRGDFCKMEHDHYFEPDDAGGTIMRDLFYYEVPYGIAGAIVDRFYLRGYMRRLLQTRNAHIKALAEANHDLQD